jgi:hypothetical protein
MGIPKDKNYRTTTKNGNIMNMSGEYHGNIMGCNGIIEI